jgi:hypothetical protein
MGSRFATSWIAVGGGPAGGEGVARAADEATEGEAAVGATEGEAAVGATEGEAAVGAPRTGNSAQALTALEV